MSADGSLPDTAERGEPVEELVSSLHDRFWGRVRMFAARRLGDRAAAEDVAQETLRRVIDALRGGRVAHLDALPAFVFQTARNICMHDGRSARRRDAAFVRLRSGDESADDPLAALVTAEQARAVREELSAMADQDRELLEMIYVAELDSAEITRRLGVTPGALRVRKHRALERLGRRLAAARNESASSGTREREW